MILRTDLNIAQLPNPLPNFSLGKNTIQQDPNFGTQIVRLTDETDDVDSFLTADGPEAPIWNYNDTMLLGKTNGKPSTLFQFDPKKMQGKNLNIQLKGKVGFSRKSPGVIFQMEDGHTLNKLIYKKVLGIWTYQSTVFMCDFATQLPTGFKINWTGSLNITQDDTTFVMCYSEGAQETGFTVICWKKGKGFRTLNTNTGVVTGQWGPLGPVTITSTANYAFPFTLHEGSISPNPTTALFTVSPKSGGGRFYWLVATTQLVDIPVSGHAARGYSHIYAGGPGGGQIAELSYTNPPFKRLIVPQGNLPQNQVPPQVYKGDSHFGFGKIDVADHSIFWVSSQSDVTPFTSAFMNEIRGYDAQTGIVSRASHTFNSGLEDDFIAIWAIACPSQTGKFIAWTTDMMGTLKNKRADIFIVQVAT